MIPPPIGAPPPGTGGPPPPAAGDGTWDDLRRLGVQRDTERQWFGGVCAGLALRFGVDPLLIRAAAVVLALVGGLGIVLYLLAWLFLPDGGGRILAQQVGRGDTVAGVLVAALAVVVLGALVLDRGPLRVLWWALPLALVGWLVLRSRRGPTTPTLPTPTPGAPMTTPPLPQGTVPPPTAGPRGVALPTAPPGAGTAPPGAGWQAPATRSGPAGAPGSPAYGSPAYGPAAYATGTTTYGTGTYGTGTYGIGAGGPAPVAPPPARPRRPSASGWFGLVAVGLAVLGFGAGYLLDRSLTLTGPAGLLGLVLALAAVALLTLVLGLTGRRAWMPATLTWVLAAAALVGAVGLGVSRAVPPSETVTWRPTSVSGPVSYGFGAGQGTLDLTALDVEAVTPAQPAEMDVSIGAGQLTIVVPRGMDARVDAQVGLGAIRREPAAGSASDPAPEPGGGVGQRRTLTFGDGPPVVRIDASMGAGELILKES
jgi:phage shock protein PspC (stress-responsive transcriptional regulator)